MEIKTFENEEKKTIVRVRAVDDGGDLLLVAVDKYGERLACGTLLILTSQGKIKRSINVNKEFGFCLDEKGQIEVEE